MSYYLPVVNHKNFQHTFCQYISFAPIIKAVGMHLSCDLLGRAFHLLNFNDYMFSQHPYNIKAYINVLTSDNLF